ncbi:MAG: CDP-alcohol phosphatidyltransferase family protein [Candidatus Thorarchaeota archaeon]
MAVARPLASRGVRPNTLTYLTLLFALLAFLILLTLQNQPLYGVMVFLLGFFDGVDGAVARLANKSSIQGAFTDSVIDKIAEFLILFTIMLSYPTESILQIPLSVWIVLCVIGWILTSYTRARAENLGVTDLDVGLGARSERLFTLVVFSVVGLLMMGVIVVTMMGLLTAAYRFRHYTNELTQMGIATGA